MIISVNDHAVTVFLFHILDKFPGKTNFVSAEGKREKVISFDIKDILFIFFVLFILPGFPILLSFISEPHFLNRCLKKLNWIFLWSAVEKFLHFLHCVGLKDIKSRSTSTIHNLSTVYVTFLHNFADKLWIILLYPVQMVDFFPVHQETYSGNVFLRILFDLWRVSGSHIYHHSHEVLSCG